MERDGYVPSWAYSDEEERDTAFYRGWLMGTITTAILAGLTVTGLLLWI